MRHNGPSDLRIKPDDLSLGIPIAGKEDLVGIRDRQLLTLDLDVLLRGHTFGDDPSLGSGGMDVWGVLEH